MGKKQLAHEYFQAPPYDVLLDPRRFAERWERTFGRVAPLHVEIGMGLGHHLLAFAAANPEMNHLGLEIKMHRIYSARQASLRAGITNLRFIPGDARRTLEALAPRSVSRLTLLFPDPWPRHPDRRLTSPDYLALYADVLAPQGVMHFRTDDPALFEYSLAQFRSARFLLTVAVPRERVLTAFERRWLGEGKAIFGVDARLPSI
ncbi:MAG: tRNA (guanosine(46)-N7)-methyltransferase TrmB [Candidatus Sericytochromatia bacterium]|nr:tRNA (guanosine(46)-N7)-methyltransferase TrmB [Candidatus Sericytochromatia bacterium]